jgi:AcrR family transcriptional regulator
VSPSLREERRSRTSTAISTAALDLFLERGYAAVTVAEVAAAARVGERTLYRYFADKEDLLFSEDEGFQAAFRAAVEHRPAGESPWTVVREASAAVAAALEDRREEVRRRGEVIASAPALTARERAKHAAWEAVLAEALTERGVDPDPSRLLGRVAVACYDEALTRWLARDSPQRPLTAELDAAFAELGSLVQ